MWIFLTKRCFLAHSPVVLALTRNNADATMALTTLYKILKIFQEYFETVEEESIRDNFVIIYELLDEIVDFGYPQNTEPTLLKEYDNL